MLSIAYILAIQEVTTRLPNISIQTYWSGSKALGDFYF